MTLLPGYKTYFIAILTATITLLHKLGRIDDAMFKTLMALLGSGALATVSAKINRLQKDVRDFEAMRHF